jgi:hypothetical protein
VAGVTDFSLKLTPVIGVLEVRGYDLDGKLVAAKKLDV